MRILFFFNKGAAVFFRGGGGAGNIPVDFFGQIQKFKEKILLDYSTIGHSNRSEISFQNSVHLVSMFFLTSDSTAKKWKKIRLITKKQEKLHIQKKVCNGEL